ncbi:MAG: response regulator [Chitinophagales bacterium]|nr:response regulator [Chitinophagales bacterium]MDW8273465.1 response regulator [Chitinophagales bacterium]
MELIYIVDDDQANNFLCKLVLEDCGINPSIVQSFYKVKDVLEALNQATSESRKFPDLLLLDINLPGIDGWDFLKEYKNFPQHIRSNTKIFLLSSSIFPEDYERAKSCQEVIDFIPKPLTTELMQEILDTYFSSKVQL